MERWATQAKDLAARCVKRLREGAPGGITLDLVDADGLWPLLEQDGDDREVMPDAAII